MHQLTQIFPVNTRFLADTGNNLAWAIHYLNPLTDASGNVDSYHVGIASSTAMIMVDGSAVMRYFRFVRNFCSMGWSPGVPLAQSVGKTQVSLLSVLLVMAVFYVRNEITVALQEKLSVIFLVLNDTSLGMVKHGQILNESESIGHYLPKVNFFCACRSDGHSRIQSDNAQRA